MKLKIFITIILLLIIITLICPFCIPLKFREGGVATHTLAYPQSRFVTISTDNSKKVDIHYLADESLKDQQKPAFILLHGFAANVFTWNKTMDFFKENGRVLAYDRIPFGLSEKIISKGMDKDIYHPKNILKRFVKLLDTFDIDKAVVVGNSAGATLAIQMALAYPKRVEKLILINPAVYMEKGNLPKWIVNTAQMDRIRQLIFRKMADPKYSLKKAYYDSSLITDQQLNDAGIHTQAQNWDRAYSNYVDTSFKHYGKVTDDFYKVKQPVLVVSGENDNFFPIQQSKRLTRELPNAHLAILPKCGHVPQEECPNLLQASIFKWLKTTGVSP